MRTHEGVRATGAFETRLESSRGQVAVARAALSVLGRISPELAARLTLRLFRTVRRHRVPVWELEWRATAERLEVESSRGRLRALAWGEGPTVLMMHGWEGRASQMGSVGLALAASGLRAVSLEAPGHGSEKPRLSSLWEFADAVTGFIGEQGPVAGFVGHSYGVAAICYAGLRGSVRFGAEVPRLAFIAPPGDLHHFCDMVFRLLRLDPEVRRAFVEVMEAGLELPWDVVRFCTQGAAEDVPLLIVHDEGDADTPIEGAHAVAAAWPRSRLHCTTGLGHRRVLRDQAVLRRVADFLAGGGERSARLPTISESGT